MWSAGQVVNKQMHPTMEVFFLIFLYFKHIWDGDGKKHVLTQGLGHKKIVSPHHEAFKIQLRDVCFPSASF